MESMHKEEQTPAKQRLWLERQPQDQQGGYIPRLQHSRKRLHREEGLVILDYEGRVHLLPFVGLND